MRAGRDAGLGGSRGLSWGLWGPLGGPPGPPRRITEEVLAAPGRLWRPLVVFGVLWASTGQPLGGSGGLRGLLRASPDVLSRLLSFVLSHMLTQTLHHDVLPVPALTGSIAMGWDQARLRRICKNQKRSRCVPFFEKHDPPFVARKPFRIVKHMVFGMTVFGPFSQGPSKHVWVRFSAIRGARGPLLRPRRKHSSPS